MRRISRAVSDLDQILHTRREAGGLKPRFDLAQAVGKIVGINRLVEKPEPVRLAAAHNLGCTVRGDEAGGQGPVKGAQTGERGKPVHAIAELIVGQNHVRRDVDLGQKVDLLMYRASLLRLLGRDDEADKALDELRDSMGN